MTILPTMLLISGAWHGTPTFKMIPVSNDCPYNEAIFAGEQGVLAVVGKSIKQTFQLLPRLTPQGDNEVPKRPRANGALFNEERKTLDAYYEYYVSKPEEVEAFINMFAINAASFNWKQYMPAPIETPTVVAAA